MALLLPRQKRRTSSAACAGCRGAPWLAGLWPACPAWAAGSSWKCPLPGACRAPCGAGLPPGGEQGSPWGQLQTPGGRQHWQASSSSSQLPLLAPPLSLPSWQQLRAPAPRLVPLPVAPAPSALRPRARPRPPRRERPPRRGAAGARAGGGRPGLRQSGPGPPLCTHSLRVDRNFMSPLLSLLIITFVEVPKKERVAQPQTSR